MLLGLIKPTSGKIEIFGEDLAKNQKEILRRILLLSISFGSIATQTPMQ